MLKRHIYICVCIFIYMHKEKMIQTIYMEKIPYTLCVSLRLMVELI